MKQTIFLMGLVLCFLSSCDKDNSIVNDENDTHVSPQNSAHANFSPKWISLIDDSKDNGELDISSKYLGIQGWSCKANPPYIYVGGTFDKGSFSTSFDKEVTNKKNPINLTFDFKNPYLTNMETVTYTGYLKKVKEAINSEEFSAQFKFSVAIQSQPLTKYSTYTI